MRLCRFLCGLWNDIVCSLCLTGFSLFTQVRACLQSNDPAGDLSVHLSVQDQGIGISPADQTRLFKVKTDANEFNRRSRVRVSIVWHAQCTHI